MPHHDYHGRVTTAPVLWLFTILFMVAAGLLVVLYTGQNRPTDSAGGDTG